MTRKINLGFVPPETIETEDGIVLFNRFTSKKIYTDNKIMKEITPSELEKLTSGNVEITEPELKKLRLELTLLCNADCDYCLVYKNEIPQIGNSMELTTTKKIVKKFNSKIQDGSIMAIGGEPFIKKESLVYILENANGRIGVYTNGTLITPDIMPLLKKPNVATFFSFDGPEELNFHRKYKGGKPLFEDTLKGYLSLLEAGANTAVNCLVTNSNVNSMLDIVQNFHEKYGENSFGLSMPHHTKINNFEVDIVKYTENMKKLFDYAKNEGIYVDQIAKRLSPLLDETFRYYACKMVGEQETFYPNGSKTLCTKIDTIPELKDKDKSYFESLLPINNEGCYNCSSISVCGGGCFWDRTFSDDNMDARECHYNNGMLVKILQDIGGHINEKNKVVDMPPIKPIYKKMVSR